MRCVRVTLVLSLVLLGQARAELHADPELTLAEKTASSWMATVVDPKAQVAVSRDRPLDYVIDSPQRSCRGVRAGRAQSTGAAARVKRCVFDTWKDLSHNPATQQRAREWELDKTVDAFAPRLRKGMKTSATNATVVSVQYVGSGRTMNAWVVVARDGTVRAIWMYRNEAE